MQLITNENVPTSVVQALRDHGHDVLAVKESMRGEDDTTILKRAAAESRLVVTHDKDFGELAFRIGLPAPCRVILFRLTTSDPQLNAQRMLDVIESRADWQGLFAVATDDRLRTRPLPRTPGS